MQNLLTLCIKQSISSLPVKKKESFTISASGNGATKERAKDYAIEKLVNKYFSEYSSI